jgi:hypothetical protein
MAGSLADAAAWRDLSGLRGVALGAALATLVPLVLGLGRGGKRLPGTRLSGKHREKEQLDQDFWSRVSHAGTSPRRVRQRPRPRSRNQHGR